jgi:hypothetical protein
VVCVSLACSVDIVAGWHAYNSDAFQMRQCMPTGCLLGVPPPSGMQRRNRLEVAAFGVAIDEGGEVFLATMVRRHGASW